MEHSQKNRKQIQKRYSGFISSQTWLGPAEKDIKKFSFQVPFQPNLGWSILKKRVKNSKTLS